MAKRLENHYPVLFRGANGTCAHEFIIDLRGLTKARRVQMLTHDLLQQAQWRYRLLRGAQEFVVVLRGHTEAMLRPPCLPWPRSLAKDQYPMLL